MPRLSLLGGVWAAFTSSLLLVVVLTRDVGVNFVNGWTIILGFVAGFVLIPERFPKTRPAYTLAQVLLVLAAAPALVGGFGLLYVPSIVLVSIAQFRGESVRREHS